MACLGCNNIEVNPKKLHDGRTVCNSCADWRQECEARAVIALGSLNERRAHLDAVQARSGLPARQALESNIKALWPKR